MLQRGSGRLYASLSELDHQIIGGQVLHTCTTDGSTWSNMLKSEPLHVHIRDAPQLLAVPFRLSHSLVILWIWRVPPPSREIRCQRKSSHVVIDLDVANLDPSMPYMQRAGKLLVCTWCLSLWEVAVAETSVNTYPWFPCQYFKKTGKFGSGNGGGLWTGPKPNETAQDNEPKGNPFLAASQYLKYHLACLPISNSHFSMLSRSERTSLIRRS